LIWDGRDSLDVLLPDGDYPYVMVASEPIPREILFADTLIATIDCDSPVEHRSWGILKEEYRGD